MKGKCGEMAGITSIGAYIPMYRLSLEEITRFWHTKSASGEKAVAGYDEDSITMAVAAATDCLKGSDEQPQGLYFATTTSPFREKQAAAVIASAIDLKKECLTADFTNSLRAGTIALRAAADTVKSGSATSVLIAASDCRLGGPQGRNEQLFGDGAAAVVIGSDQTIADIEASCSLFNDFTDYWRNSGDEFVQSAEGRFIDVNGYTPTMLETISTLMKKNSVAPADFSKIVFYATDIKSQGDMARKLGFEKTQIQDPLFAQIGNTGSAATFIVLAAALEEAKAGDGILFAGYGDGCDAFILRVTKNIEKMRHATAMKARLARKTSLDYGKYLNWKNLVPIEAANLPARSEPSLATRWRDRKSVRALYGVRCKKCGTPQLHPIGQAIRICNACQTKDEFEEYKFSDKKGKLFSYAIDQLQPTKNPPGLNGVVDFDEGGRLICELTDYDLTKVKIGMPVEMSYRKMLQGEGIINYFWKAKPVA
jgi:hydroxymethylglutaryl-CoA synthase